MDALCPLVAADPEEGVEDVLALEAQPALLALVDVCCSEEGLELAKGALAAAVEALPPAARFGLVSFGSQARARRGPRGWCGVGWLGALAGGRWCAQLAWSLHLPGHLRLAEQPCFQAALVASSACSTSHAARVLCKPAISGATSVSCQLELLVRTTLGCR